MAYAGFDRAACPPLDLMLRLKRETNLAWCGYYLDAPSCARANSGSWRGQRTALVAQGWGLAPIFVGQQTVESGPGAHNLTTTQGSADGARACAVMRAEGFPAGSWVYLDLENGPPFGTAQRAYVGAWIAAVEAGKFRAGVYCSYLIAKTIKAAWPAARVWAFRVPTTQRHAVAGKTFPAPDPTGAAPGASLWQRDMAVTLADFGDLLVDLDVAAMRDPSAPSVAAGGDVAPAAAVIAPPAALPSAALPAALAPALRKPATGWVGFLAGWLFGRPY